MFRCLLNNATRFGLLSLTAIAFLSNGGHAEEKDSAPKSLIPIDQVEGPLPDDFIVAELDGTPIRFGEFIDELDYGRKLRELQLKLSPGKVRELQEGIVRRDLKVRLESHLLIRKFLDSLSEEESVQSAKALEAIWQNAVESRIKQINQESNENLANIEELRKYHLDHHEIPLELWRKQLEDRVMASEALLRNITVKDKVKREQATRAFIEYLYANADVRTCLDGTTD